MDHNLFGKFFNLLGFLRKQSPPHLLNFFVYKRKSIQDTPLWRRHLGTPRLYRATGCRFCITMSKMQYYIYHLNRALIWIVENNEQASIHLGLLRIFVRPLVVWTMIPFQCLPSDLWISWQKLWKFWNTLRTKSK